MDQEQTQKMLTPVAIEEPIPPKHQHEPLKRLLGLLYPEQGSYTPTHHADVEETNSRLENLLKDYGRRTEFEKKGRVTKKLHHLMGKKEPPSYESITERAEETLRDAANAYSAMLKVNEKRFEDLMSEYDTISSRVQENLDSAASLYETMERDCQKIEHMKNQLSSYSGEMDFSNKSPAVNYFRLKRQFMDAKRQASSNANEYVRTLMQLKADKHELNKVEYFSELNGMQQMTIQTIIERARSTADEISVHKRHYKGIAKDSRTLTGALDTLSYISNVSHNEFIEDTGEIQKMQDKYASSCQKEEKEYREKEENLKSMVGRIQNAYDTTLKDIGSLSFD